MKIRLPDLSMSFQHDEKVLLRAAARGLGARVPPAAVAVLAFCAKPRNEAEITAAMGPTGGMLFRGLVDAGFLVDPSEAAATPVFFDNFASVDIHRRMLADDTRLDAYHRALQSLVGPKTTVLDAGTGSGVLACLAAQAGAERVFAVDNADLLDVARDTIRAAGLSDRIEVIQGDFANVDVPAQVDVIVTETFGAFALAEGSSRDLRACAARHLKDQGRIIPSAVELWLAPVGDGQLLKESVEVFQETRGLTFPALNEAAMHRARTVEISPDSLLHAGKRWAELAYPDDDTPDGELSFSDLPAGELVGLAGWFVLRLAEGVELPTGPADPQTHWHQVFLPLPRTDVAAGSTLSLRVHVEPAPDDRRAIEIHTEWTLGDMSGNTWHRVR